MKGIMELLWKYGRGIIFLILVAYFTSMVLLPIYEGGSNWWSHTQNVWSHWQTLNAAMIALASSIVAFRITQFTSSEQRKRKFKANFAFLPHELSVLSTYCEESMNVFSEAWDRANGPKEKRNGALVTVPPAFPEGHAPIFMACIEYSTSDDFENILVILLTELQLHNARMQDLYEEFKNDGPFTSVNTPNLIAYFYKIAKIKVLIDRLFPFARSQEKLNTAPYSYDNFRSVLRIGGVDVEGIVIKSKDENPDFGLEGFIKRAIKREEKEK